MNKKKIIAGVAAVVVIAVLGTAIAFAYTKGQEQEEEDLGENQRYVYAYITEIEGNEVTYTELDESVVTAYLEQQEASDENDDADEKDKTSENDRTEGDNQATDGDSDAEAGEASQSGGMPSGMPSGDFSDGEMPSGMPSGDTSRESGRGNMGGSEAVTTLIPVGVTVHTTSGAETTFQRLVSGDMVKILMETNAEGEEVIIEIWML